MKKQQLFWIVGLGVTLVLAGVVSVFASGSPDGLESVAEKFGFIDSAKDSAVAGTPLNDYAVTGIDNARLSTGLAGVIGVVITGVVAYALFAWAKRKN